MTSSPIKRLTLGLGELERQALCADILLLAATTPTFASHNRGGWRSPPTWLKTSWLHARLAMLLAVHEPDADPATLVGWAVVNRQGAFHKAHTHNAKYAWSGIVYLDPGGPNSGATVFEWSPTRYTTQTERVEPATDLVVIFSSQLGHAVEVHPNATPRITVAFDVAKRVRRTRP